MTPNNLAYADPTMPGLSARDFARRAVDAIQSMVGAPGQESFTSHRDYLIRHDLSRLDQEMLRDLGLDRDRM